MAIKFGTPRADTLIGSDGTDFLLGGAGNDVIRGYDVGSGEIDVRASYYDTADFLFGGVGSDLLHAGAGNDVLSGGNGRDTLHGGLDVDYLLGGSGQDTFLFDVLYASPGAPSPDTGVGQGERDVILDFRQGQDKIDLRGWENDYGGVLGADFIGQADASAEAKLQVGFRYEGDSTIIELSRLWFVPNPDEPPGYYGPVGEIEILGRVDLQASDFIFSA